VPGSTGGGDTVNQSATMSFDPATMKCIICSREHDVIQSAEKPMVVILSDQNFVPIWPGDCGETSAGVIRLLNPSLHELVDLLLEVFERRNIPDGSVILISSVSYLHRVGTSFYAREWTEVASRLGRRWPNVRVGPLAPLIRENCQGGVVRELVEIGSWYSKVYTGSPHGMQDVWNKTITKTIERSMGQTTLNSVESYTLTLPAGLDRNSPDMPNTLFTNSSRPSMLYGMDQGTVDEILDTVRNVLSRDFNISAGTGGNAGSARADGCVQENVKRVVLVGASVLKRVAHILREEGYDVVDLCTPGWTVTPENVDALTAQLKQCNPCQNTAFILDLFGNSCFRATLFDGSTTMPIKGGGCYHLPGSVTVCPDEVFLKLIDTAMPVIEAVKCDVKILIPPLPRYLFSGCCENPLHCVNVKENSHAETLLSATSRLRTSLKRKLAETVPGTTWVMESCSVLIEAAELTIVEKLSKLRTVYGTDGVHLRPEGTENLSKNIIGTIKKFEQGVVGRIPFENRSAAVSISGEANRHYWKGFASPVGSNKHPKQSWAKYPREKDHRQFGPYRRWGRGGKGFWKN